jgi:hypothetical protein
LGGKILKAIEDQGQLIANLSVQGGLSNNSTNGHPPEPHDLHVDETGDEIEAHSRKDVLSTPITASDDILKWNVFPADEPIRTLPASVFSAKMNPYSNGLLLFPFYTENMDSGD